MYSYISVFLTIIVAVFCIISEIKRHIADLNSDIHVTDYRLVSFFNRKSVCCVSLILLFTVFLASRLFHLGITPTGLHIDECGMAYDAYSLSHSLKDRWGMSVPFYLTNFHTGQSAMYAYLTAVLMRFHEFTPALIRMPAVIMSSFAFFALFGIGKRITGNNLGGLLACALMIVTPFFLISERWALDCNLFLSMATVALFFTLKAVEVLFKSATATDTYEGVNPIIMLFIAGLMWGIALYTYIISYIIVPLFIIFSSLIVIVRIRRISCPGGTTATSYVGFHRITALLASYILPVVLCGAPLLLEQLVNLRIFPEFKFLCFNFFVFCEERFSDFTLSEIGINITKIPHQLLFGDQLSYNALPQFGAIFMPMAPLVIYGLYLCTVKVINGIRKHSFEGLSYSLIGIFALISFMLSLCIREVTLNRYNELFLPILLFILIAIWEMFSNIPSKLSFAGSIASVTAICVCFSFFAIYYFCDMNDDYDRHILFCTTEYGEAIRYADRLYGSDIDNEQKIYVEIEYDDVMGEDLLVSLYGNISPTDWLAYEKGDDRSHIGRIMMHFPKAFDENEDAIYILGNNWNHISDYLRSIGFNTDYTFSNYQILYK